MNPVEWFGLATLCFAGAASPGPSLAVVLAANMGGGRPAGLVSAWAHALGVGLYAALTVVGLGTVITANVGLFRALQIAGAAYLLWLAFGMWKNARSASAIALNTAPLRMEHAARDGFAIAFLNPKLAVFMLALFSQFIKPDAGIGPAALMVGTAILIDGLWYSLVSLVLTRGNWIELLRQHAAIVDRIFAALLTAVASYILWGVLVAA